MDKSFCFLFFFMFSFFNVPFNCLAESVDRWTSSEHSEKKINPIYVLFKSVDLQTRSCLSIFCFFLALHPSKSCQKVCTQVMKMLKICLFVCSWVSLTSVLLRLTNILVFGEVSVVTSPLGWLCTGA